uniref:Uncharacterized protein n=1 Tax=Arundo donax TaxID=35708 RepID=A0A0A9DJN0_ARUDO
MQSHFPDLVNPILLKNSYTEFHVNANSQLKRSDRI